MSGRAAVLRARRTSTAPVVGGARERASPRAALAHKHTQSAAARSSHAASRSGLPLPLPLPGVPRYNRVELSGIGSTDGSIAMVSDSSVS